MSETEDDVRICGRCGQEAAGFASVWTAATGDVPYCHGDDEDFTCYEGSQIVDPDAFGAVRFLLRPSTDASEREA